MMVPNSPPPRRHSWVSGRPRLRPRRKNAQAASSGGGAGHSRRGRGWAKRTAPGEQAMARTNKSLAQNHKSGAMLMLAASVAAANAGDIGQTMVCEGEVV